MIKYRTVMNAEVTKQINKDAMKRLAPMFTIISAILVIMGVLGIAFPEAEEDIGLGIFLIIYGLLFYPFILLVIRIAYKKQTKSMQILSDETIEEFTFDSGYLEITQTKGTEFYGLTRCKYECLFQVQDTKDYFYLFISNSQSYIIPKSAIIMGTNDQTSTILSLALGKKYKLKA